MKKLMAIIAIIGIVAYVGSTVSPSFASAKSTVSVVDNQQSPNDDKCPTCGKENCDGKCKSTTTKTDKGTTKTDCGTKKSDCGTTKSSSCCDKKKK